ncbi:hypothetical protein Micbo1qcDRAFT_206166 [Microdochium bolleyi]|uniref:Uncharacterized protein n=1 Tax=Microdochium bolleyi TaxID=196109 RepID=A0A136IY47_9PEZI|nr:hypothetical protein Micbo1qcDRAFT_206166 [Microdochium bolleyi]
MSSPRNSTTSDQYAETNVEHEHHHESRPEKVATPPNENTSVESPSSPSSSTRSHIESSGFVASEIPKPSRKEHRTPLPLAPNERVGGQSQPSKARAGSQFMLDQAPQINKDGSARVTFKVTDLTRERGWKLICLPRGDYAPSSHDVAGDVLEHVVYEYAGDAGRFGDPLLGIVTCQVPMPGSWTFFFALGWTGLSTEDLDWAALHLEFEQISSSDEERGEDA